MRRKFTKLIEDVMKINNNIFVITADLGYGMWDSVRLNFKDRFLNVGSAEMAMMGTAIGLALDGKIPIVYSITPFALYRPFEMIRNYINHEKIKVHIVGGGRNTDYGYLGFSHWATEDQQVMKIFNNIESNWPETDIDLQKCVENIIANLTPTYTNLKK